MVDRGEDRFESLLATDNAELVPVVEEVLRGAGIPFETGLQSLPAPRVVFMVPASRLDEARDRVAQYFGAGPLAAAEDTGQARKPDALEREISGFPWAPVGAVSALVLFHMMLFPLLLGPHPTADRLVADGGVVGGTVISEPWRLVTYIFLHGGPRHVLANGVSMMVFAVPLILGLGYVRTAAIYVAAGIAGGVAAAATSGAETVTIGSSGAVAGLFGAWLAIMIRRARRAPLSRRGLLRAIGLGLLVLPSLLTPTTSGGQHVSIAGHLGGLGAGALIGSWLRVEGERLARVGVSPPTARIPPGGPSPPAC